MNGKIPSVIDLLIYTALLGALGFALADKNFIAACFLCSLMVAFSQKDRLTKI